MDNNPRVFSTFSVIIIILVQSKMFMSFLFFFSLMQYTLNEPDPLVQGILKRDNPFIKKGGCTIL